MKYNKTINQSTVFANMAAGVFMLLGIEAIQAETVSDDKASVEYLAADEKGVIHLFPQPQWLKIHGWMDGSFVYNTDDPNSNVNGPYNAGYLHDKVQLNQLYLIVEKPLTRSGWDIGGRLDVLYGTDYYLTQSDGFERDDDGTPDWNKNHRYGVALPQLYLEVGTASLSTKIGHFYTPIGYEGVPATVNFFHSKSYPYQFAGPFTHWGGLTAWKFSDSLTFQGGLVNGWDALDRDKNRVAGILGVNYDAHGLWALSMTVISGDEPGADPRDYENRTRYSLIFKLRPTEHLEYVFHHHLSVQQAGKRDGGTSLWYGIDNYLFYRFTDQVKAGLRFEWFRDDDGTRVSGSPDLRNPNTGSFQGSYYSLSAGINFLPHPNVLIRPEVRSDWYTGDGRPYDDGKADNQVLLAINLNIRY